MARAGEICSVIGICIVASHGLRNAGAQYARGVWKRSERAVRLGAHAGGRDFAQQIFHLCPALAADSEAVKGMGLMRQGVL